jgi:hypothetical protein
MTSAVRDPEHWRSRAKEARALAELIIDPESKRGMLTIADEYEKIAKRSDYKRSRRHNHSSADGRAGYWEVEVAVVEAESDGGAVVAEVSGAIEGAASMRTVRVDVAVRPALSVAM